MEIRGGGEPQGVAVGARPPPNTKKKKYIIEVLSNGSIRILIAKQYFFQLNFIEAN
jgi:hypothetical protein